MISLSPFDYAVVGLFILLVVCVGYMARGQSMHDAQGYLLAGRRVTLPAFVATLVATWYGGILGVGEYAHLYGISTWFTLGLPYYLYALVFAFFLAHRVRDGGAISIPMALGRRFGRPAALVGAVLVFLMANPAPYVLMQGELLQIVMRIPLLPAMVVGTILSIVYLYRGGLSADVRVNMVQFAAMFIGFGALMPFLLAEHGLSWLPAHLPSDALTWHGGSDVAYIAAWYFIAAQTLVDPGFHQRCAAAQSGGVARRGILWSLVCWALFDFMTITAGLYSRALLGPLDRPTLAYPLLAEKLLPAGLLGLFVVGMLATVMSSVVSYTFLAASTFGHDMTAGEREPAGDPRAVLRTRLGLTLVTVIACVLAYTVRSVVQLWYLLGSAFIPGLLPALWTAYFTDVPISGRLTAGIMLSATLLSAIWIGAGLLAGGASAPVYPWNIQPIYPGLLVGCAWMGWLCWRGRTTRAER